MRRLVNMCLLLFATMKVAAQDSYPPEAFMYTHETIPTARHEIRYAGTHNFMGKPVTGYEKPVALLTKETAEALAKVQKDLLGKGYSIKIFDAYRPQQAVDHFIRWAREPEATEMKQEFYPEVDKKDLFNLGYIASKSGHSRGSTIDLTLVDTATGKELDMGSPYDFFGDISHHGSPKITPEQEKNRNLLKQVMLNAGFRPYAKEWWHYTLINEPYPDTYFDFPVK